MAAARSTAQDLRETKRLGKTQSMCLEAGRHMTALKVGTY